jgi:putative membrane protein
MSITPRNTFAMLLAMLLLGACGGDEAPAASADTDAKAEVAEAPEREKAPAPPRFPTGDLTAPLPIDGPALVATIDEHEIDASQLAMTRTARVDIKKFAYDLQKAHRDHQVQARALPGGLRDTPAVKAQRQKGKDIVAELGGIDAEFFDAAYLNAMAASQGEAIELIDSQLIPGATDEKVIEFLTRTRETVAANLERVRALQAVPATKP